MMRSKMKRLSGVTVVVLLAAVGTQAAVWTWGNYAGDNVFTNSANWISESDVYEFPASETMVIELSGSDRAILSEGITPNMDGLRVGYQNGALGAFEQTGGVLNITAFSGRETVVGHGGGTGTWLMSGGEAHLNNLSVGASGVGTLTISGGVMDIDGSYNGGSLLVGAENSSGDGSVTVSGGTLTTDSGIILGNGSGASSCLHVIGGGLVDVGSVTAASSGFWTQDGSSTLKATIDSENGFSLGRIVLFDGSGDNPSVTFESGATLEVGFSDVDYGSGSCSWELMSWPAGTTVVDHGLAFAAGIDLETWSFSITETGLTLIYNGARVNYTGVTGGEWATGTNWSHGAYPTRGDIARLDTTANLSIAATNNIQALRIGTQGEGRLQIGSQAILLADSSASVSSLIGGGSGNQGSVQQEGGTVTINRLEIGSDSASGTYHIHCGNLALSGESGGTSLFLGTNADVDEVGTGTFRISSGNLATRAGVYLGSSAGGIGRFEVIGSYPGSIAIGSISTRDGKWTQNTGSTLSVRIDKTPQGITPIFIDEVGDDGGGDVLFEKGALLDVGFTAAFLNGGPFTVMEWEGEVTDNGLQFVSSVDTNLWSFQVDAVNKRLTVTAAGNPISRNFVHPGTTHTRSDLERMRDMVAAGIEPYATSFERLSSNKLASFSYTVQKDPAATAIVGRTAMVSDGTAAYYNALMWNITGDERHAQKAVEIFNAYANVTSMDFSIPLEAGLAGWRMLDAAEMIKYTYDGWAQTDIDQFSDMLVYPGYSNTTVPTANIEADQITLYWKLYNGDPKRAGNQGIHCMRTLLALGIFLDNELIYDRALRYLQGAPAREDDIPYPSGPPINGPAEDDGPYRISYPYTGVESTVPDYGYDELIHNYIWPNGQCQETSRDQDHALGGVHLLTLASEMAWSQGDDLYGYLDNRILLGMEFAVRYNLSFSTSYPDQLTPWEPRVETGEFIQRLSRTGRNFSLLPSPTGRGDRNDHPVYESNLAHYRDRLGLPSERYTWLERGLDYVIQTQDVETEGSTTSDAAYGGLTLHRVSPGDPIRGFVGDVPDFAMNVLPMTIEAENYDYFAIDGESRTYHDLSVGNLGAAYRPVASVDLRPASEGGYAITSIEAGEWVTYTVSVPTNGSYAIRIRYTSTAPGGTIRCSFDDVDLTGDVSIPNGASHWQDLVIASDVQLSTGVQQLRMNFGGASNAFELNSISLEGPLSRYRVSTTKSDTAPVMSNTDLAQTQYVSSSITGGGDVDEDADLFNGSIGNEDGDADDNGEVRLASGSTVTVTFDTSVYTNGYNLTGITTCFGWDPTNGGRSNQGYEILVTTVDGATTSLAGPEHWEPNDAPAAYWTTVSFVPGDVDVLANRVQSVTFNITNGGNAGSTLVAREFDIFGTPTLSAEEYIAATALEELNVSNGNMNAQFFGVVGAEYTVEWASNLTNAAWVPMTNIYALAQSPFAVTYPATNSSGFYRVRWVP